MTFRKSVAPLIVLFFIVMIVAIGFRLRLEHWGFNVEVLLIGNAFLCLITLISSIMLRSGLKAKSTAGFLRGVYGSFMLKLIFVVLVVFTYVRMNEGGLNKPALFTCMALYLVYTFIEIRGLTKLSRDQHNA